MKELPIRAILKSITRYRLNNALKLSAGFIFSKLLGYPFVWGQPFVVTIEPTNLCNLACPQCAVGAGVLTRPRGQMPLDLYRDILEQMHRSLCYLLLYDQGEPLLHTDYCEMIRLAKAKNMAVTCSSNGQLLGDKDIARCLVASGLDNLIISIDGLTEQTYQTYRKGGQLSKAIQAIKNVQQARSILKTKTPRICVQFLVTKHNETELPHLAEAVRDWGADLLLIKSMQICTPADAEQWLPRQEKYRRYRTRNNQLVTKKRNRICPRLWYSSVIHQDGSVVACCFDKDNQFVLGRMTETPFTQLWHGSALQALRTAVLNKTKPNLCRNCTNGLALYK